MSSLVIDRQDLNDVLHDLRFHISRSYNSSDPSEKARSLVKAEAIYGVLEVLDLLNESQKVSYSADITDLYKFF